MSIVGLIAAIALLFTWLVRDSKQPITVRASTPTIASLPVDISKPAKLRRHNNV